ncbi:MAG TPA: CapA family protein [Actinophytocola sp.]|uniref:CapA family protein n=1 Tax=Actinophytocola sp. TaxID=1872138 RepID=UPI002DBD40F2|nr:CapA family protein [Actinophytocola sp.]HEU5473229.1 CapA family protein [Actinophytocola sp.]
MRRPVPRVVTLLLAGVLAGCAAPATGRYEPMAVPRAAPRTGAEQAARTPGEVVLTIAGDVHFAERTTKLLDDPASAFGPVAELFTGSDIAVVNLETAVTTRGTAEPKKYLFRAPPSAYDAVKAAGIDLVSLGNNHVLDYGRVGLADSLAAARSAGVPTVGAGQDADAAWAPWITEANGVRIAFLGISQVHELEASWAATDERAGVAHARDRDRAVRAVRAAREQADLVAVIMHWGKEGSDCPTAEMRSFAAALAGAGADLIAGTHAHLLLGDGWLDRTYVAYGLGNFLWWWNDAYSNDTGVLRVTVRDKKIAGAELVPAYISRETGQPMPVTGAEAERITAKFTGLRECTGLAESPR